MEAQDMITAIINWAESENPDFDTNFVESVQAKLSEHGELTPGQVDGLERIVKGFRIDVETWCD